MGWFFHIFFLINPLENTVYKNLNFCSLQAAGFAVIPVNSLIRLVYNSLSFPVTTYQYHAENLFSPSQVMGFRSGTLPDRNPLTCGDVSLLTLRLMFQFSPHATIHYDRLVIFFNSGGLRNGVSCVFGEDGV